MRENPVPRQGRSGRGLAGTYLRQEGLRIGLASEVYEFGPQILLK